MIINNIEKDFRVLCINEDKKQSDIAESMGRAKQSLHRAVTGEKSSLSAMLVEAFEELGYDLRIEYVKREVSDGE